VEGKGDVGELVPFFTNISAFIIILGGTFGATVLSSGQKDIKRMPKIIARLLKTDKMDFIAMIDGITSLAEKARREGLLALEGDVADVQDPLLGKGLRLVIDGTDPELVEAILQTNLLQKKNEAANDAVIFETLGGFAPTMGMVGAIMGLVGALKRMSTSGMANTVQALAVAFIASFWGIAFANLLFLPICNKVRSRWKNELVMGQIIIEGIRSIQGGNNPRIVREMLLSFLPVEEAEAAVAAGGEAAA
jgi:chemotaxis protein MotA